jgi:hypothetical protein
MHKKPNDDRFTSDPEFMHVKQTGESMPPVMYAELVKKQVDRYGSQRLVAGGLEKDEGTIRRCVQVANLSDRDKDRIRSGESVTSVLANPSNAGTADKTAGVRDKKDKRAFCNAVFERVHGQMKEFGRLNQMGAEAMHPQNKDAK